MQSLQTSDVYNTIFKTKYLGGKPISTNCRKTLRQNSPRTSLFYPISCSSERCDSLNSGFLADESSKVTRKPATVLYSNEDKTGRNFYLSLPLPQKSLFPLPSQFLWFKDSKSKSLDHENCDGSGKEDFHGDGKFSYCSDVTEPLPGQAIPALIRENLESNVADEDVEPLTTSKLELENSRESLDPIQQSSESFSAYHQSQWEPFMQGFHSLWRGVRTHLRAAAISRGTQIEYQDPPSNSPSSASSSSTRLGLKATTDWARAALMEYWKQPTDCKSNDAASTSHSSSKQACGGNCNDCSLISRASMETAESVIGMDIPHSAESLQAFLHHASAEEVKKMAAMSRLSDLAYCIPTISTTELSRHYNLTYTTSSLDEKKRLAEVVAAAVAESGSKVPLSVSRNSDVVDSIQLSAGAEAEAEQVLRAREQSGAAKQKQKQKQPSMAACPCEWFICDDDENKTRYFVIQGSDSLASWQTNVSFDPVPFENLAATASLHCVVHRGIYEAAEALYSQLLPFILSYSSLHGSASAKFQFVGHSLGGSLATLLNLMLCLREGKRGSGGRIPMSSLLPVYTFGAPSIMCGGDSLLQHLGLPLSHLQQIILHRDLVPRAFACDYPDHVTEVLRRMSSSFKSHGCLTHQKLMYAPMGTMIVLQPDISQAPHHPLLPHGPALYHVKHNKKAGERREKKQVSEAQQRAMVRTAQRAIMNNPHPLEILADPASYGTEGTISRDHDPRSYTKALFGLVVSEVRRKRRVQRQERRKVWLPLVGADEDRITDLAVRMTSGKHVRRVLKRHRVAGFGQVGHMKK